MAGTDDLVIKVTADTRAAKAGLAPLDAGLAEVRKDSEAASHALETLGRAHVGVPAGLATLGHELETVGRDSVAASHAVEGIGHAHVATPAGLATLDRDIAEVTTESGTAAAALAQLGRTKVSPTITPTLNDAAIVRARGEIARLRTEIARNIEIGADTRGAQRRIAELQSAIKKLEVPHVTTVTVQTQGLDSARAKMADLSLSLGGLGGAAGSVAGRLGGGAGAVGAGAGGSLYAATLKTDIAMVKLAADAEAARVRLDSLFGSAAAGQKIFDEITEFAKTTPFEFPEILQATATLRAFGVSADHMLETLKAIGDTASNAGAPIGDIARIYGQMLSKGKVQAEEMIQLQERGVRAWDALAISQGKSVAEVQALATAGQLGRKEIEGMLVELGKMNTGAMVKQSETLNGKLSNLSDSFHHLGVTVGQDFLPMAKAGTDGLISLLGASEKYASTLVHFVQPGLAAWELATDKATATTRDLTSETQDLNRTLGPSARTLDATAEATQANALAQKVFGEQIDETRNNLQGLLNKLQILNGEFVSTREAIANYEGAMDDLAETTKKAGKTLDLTTAEGRKNDAAFIHAAETLDTLTRKRIEDATAAGQSTDAIVAGYRQQREALLAVAIQLFRGNIPLATEYVDTLLATPEEIRTHVKLSGAEKAAADIKQLTADQQIDIRFVIKSVSLSHAARNVLEEFNRAGVGGTSAAPASVAPARTAAPVLLRPRIYINGVPTAQAQVRTVDERGRL